MVCVQACFAAGDAAAKLLAPTLPTGVTVGLRYLLGFTMVAALMRPWRDRTIVKANKPVLQIARGCAMLTATACSFGALNWLSLAENTSVIFTAPLFIAVLSGPLLGETLGWRRACAVLAGFIGVLIITRPGAHSFQLASLLSLGTAMANAAVAIISRRLADHDRPTTTMFYSTLVGACIVAPFFLLSWKGPLTGHEWMVALIMASLGTFGHWLWVLAHRYAPASTLAPFMYGQFLFAIVISYFVFDDAPDGWTLAGSAIIAAAGLYLLHRERVKHVRSANEDLPL